MKNRNGNLSYILVVCLEIVLIITAILDFVNKNWSNLFLYLLTAVCLLLPFILIRIANKRKLVLPSHFQNITLIIIFLAQYFGEIKDFYVQIWWWDLLIHIIFGGYSVIVALNLVKEVFRKEQSSTQKRFVLFTLLWAFCFSITLGTLWELFEFIVDYLFETNMVKGGLHDTATDLIAHFISALITSFIIYYKKFR